MPEQTVTVPQWLPTAVQLDDLDLVLSGCLPGVAGFVDPHSAGAAAPITLTVPAEVGRRALTLGSLDLTDPEGAPLARLTVTGRWLPEPPDESLVGLVGSLEAVAHYEFGPFRSLHRRPQDVHRTHGPDRILAVPVAWPLTRTEIAEVTEAAREARRRPLLLALVGHAMPVGLSGPALVRATLAAAPLVGPECQVVAVSAARHGGAPGWDGPDRWLVGTVASAYADRTLLLEPPLEPEPRPPLESGDRGRLPAPVREVVMTDRPPRERQGLVVFFTGLSGSGKSTLARALVDRVLEQGSRTVTLLDGDVVRRYLSKGLGFSREDRETNIRRIGYVAAEVARHGGLAVCSPIAPFEATREEVRRLVHDAGGGFVLVHVATPLAECERRDRKGLYARARAGQIPDFTGISSPYEEPREALKVDTTNRDIVDCLGEVLGYLSQEGWLHLG
ncbi:MAG TPA: adenylyl-sulfate kinase [Nocardioidaceae bacterium]|nr:adenylyl-sulfate kinase [Nocardioidaceae bacterium]